MMEIIFEILGILLVLGLILKELGFSGSVKEGMSKVVGKISALGDNSSLPAVTYPVDDSHLVSLTRQLSPHFNVLILEGAEENADLLSVVYRRQGCTVTRDIVELIWRNFLKDYFNLPANCPLSVYAAMDEDRLYLQCAYSDTGRQKIQEQRNNRRSREISAMEEIEE